MLATIKQEKVQLQFISQDFLALLSTKSTALGEPFPRPDRLGIIDMWGMTKNYTCRTGWKLGREPILPSQSTQCQMASSNSTHSRDIALPALLRAGGKKKSQRPSCLAAVSAQPMEFHPTITVLDRGGKGSSCTSQMFEPAVYISRDTSFRKASHPN